MFRDGGSSLALGTAVDDVAKVGSDARGIDKASHVIERHA